MPTESVLAYADQGIRSKELSLCALCLAQGSTILSTATKSFMMKHCLKEESSVPLNYKQLDHLSHERDLEAH